MEEIMKMDGYDDCLIGVVEMFGKEPLLCYDKNKVLDRLMGDGMDLEEAHEYYEYNMLGAWVGVGTPCFVSKDKDYLQLLMDGGRTQ